MTTERSIVLMPGEGKTLFLADRGATATLKVVAGETRGQFSVVESAPMPGAPGLGRHRHRRSDEALYVLAGAVTARVGERTVQAPAGSFVFIPRGTPHMFWNPGPQPARVLVIFAPAGLERFLEETAEASRESGRPPDAATLAAIRRKHNTELVDP
ncbi:MAG TPA: cupin domain-containing protein [bacterium]|nr:cupin domain-containing protein [bacterium]